MIDLPPIDYDSQNSIINKFNLNIEHGATQIITFEYNIFKYIYSSISDNFEAISYHMRSMQSTIVEEYSAGWVLLRK